MAATDELPQFSLGKEIGVLNGQIQLLIAEIRESKRFTEGLQGDLKKHAEWDDRRFMDVTDRINVVATDLTGKINENSKQLIKVVAVGGTLLGVLEVALQMIFRG